MEVKKNTLVILISAAQLCVLSGITTGCGNINPNYLPQAPFSAYHFDSTSDGPNGNGENWQIESQFSCSSHPFIIPNQVMEDGSGDYTACPSKLPNATTSSLLVKELGSTGNSVCVIPSNKYEDGTFGPLLDPMTHAPIYQCATLDPDRGAVFTFKVPSLSYNSAIIVEASKLNALLSCNPSNPPKSGKFESCPNYSTGQFR